MQGFNDRKGNDRKAQVQHQCSVVAFFEAVDLLCTKILGDIGRDRIADETKISEKTFSTRIVAAYPASACVPKGFTTACTIIMPMDTVDCCKTDGTAMRSMEYSSCRSNLLKGLLYCRIRCRKIKNENTAEMPCAINVARAAPTTPKPSPATIQRSIKIFRMEEKISNPSGILDSPMEVNMVERMLYMNKNGKPTK